MIGDMSEISGYNGEMWGGDGARSNKIHFPKSKSCGREGVTLPLDTFNKIFLVTIAYKGYIVRS